MAGNLRAPPQRQRNPATRPRPGGMGANVGRRGAAGGMGANARRRGGESRRPAQNESAPFAADDPFGNRPDREEEPFDQFEEDPAEEEATLPPYRLVRMFSFAGDTVLDPFMGLGTTLLASARCGRNAIGVEIEPSYVKKAKTRLGQAISSLFEANPVSLFVR